MVRPSYVLGGRGMEIVHNAEDLFAFLSSTFNDSFDSPVLLDRFLNDAVEVDVDAISDGKQVIIGGIMEHIEEAGVHSGDSACSLPPYSLSESLQDKLREQTRAMAIALKVVGLMNVQFAVKDDEIFVLEVNPRASRTVPFVSKATARPLAKVAARCMAGQSLQQQDITSEQVPEFYSVKEAVFPFIKFPGVDTVLGPEMKSTGEVMGIGESFGEAFEKAQDAASYTIPFNGRILFSLRSQDQQEGAKMAEYFSRKGFEILATEGTAKAISELGVEVQRVNKVVEGRPHVVDMIKNNEFDMIINTTSGKQSLEDSYTIRREALLHKVTYYTTIAAAKASAQAHQYAGSISVNQLQELHKRITSKAES